MLDPDVKITRQTQEGIYGQDGSRTDYIRVEFYVGKHGPFVKRIPLTDYSAITRDQLVTDFAREVRV